MAESDFGDAQAAVEIAALSYDRMPSLHQLIDLTEDIRKSRQLQMHTPLPEEPMSGQFVSFREWLKANPEYHDRVRALGLEKLVESIAEPSEASA